MEIVDKVLYRGEFKTPFWEMLSHWLYQKHIDYRAAFGTMLKEDLKEAK